MTTLQADASVQTVQIIDPNDDEFDLNLKQYIHYCCDKCEYKSRENVVFKMHLDECDLPLTDIVRENVHILGEPISPIQLTHLYFWKVYPPCESFQSD